MEYYCFIANFFHVQTLPLKFW